MAETLLSARNYMRLLMVDNDALQPAMSDTECNRLINASYLDYARSFPEQFSTSATSPLASITLVTGTFVYNVTSATGIIEFTGAVSVNSSLVEQNQLERADFNELYALAKREANAGTLYPLRWAVRRISDTVNQFVLYPSPGASVNGQLIYVFGYKEPAQLAADGSTFSLIADSEVLWIARLAAIRGCGILGRSEEFVARLWSDLPQKMQLAFRKHESFKRPYPKQAEVVS